MVTSYMDSLKNGFSIDRILIQWPPHVDSTYVMAIPYWILYKMTFPYSPHTISPYVMTPPHKEFLNNYLPTYKFFMEWLPHK